MKLMKIALEAEQNREDQRVAADAAATATAEAEAAAVADLEDPSAARPDPVQRTAPEVPARTDAAGASRPARVEPAPAAAAAPARDPAAPVEEVPPLVEEPTDPTLIENALGGADDIEADLVRADIEVQAEADTGDTIREAMESLMILSASLGASIKNKSYSAESLAYMRHSANQHLSVARLKLPSDAMESEVYSIEQQYTIVQESIESGLNRLAQQGIMSFKHIVNGVSDMFKGTASKLDKYAEVLDSAEKDYNEKKGSLTREAHKGNMAGVWQFFTTEKAANQAKELVPATMKDVAVSSYLLLDYPASVKKQIEGLVRALGSGTARNKAELTRILDAIEKLQSPIDTFKKDLLGGKPLFNVTGLEIKAGKARTPVTFGGKTYQNIAKLASPMTIVESTSFDHQATKAMNGAAHVAGAAVAVGAMPLVSPLAIGSAINLAAGVAGTGSFTYTNEDIPKMIKLGRQYLDNVRKAIASQATDEAIYDRLEQALDNILTSVPEDLDGADSKALDRIDFQILQVAENLLRQGGSPVTAEMARSLKGVKYCGYIVQRMIAGAK